MLKLIRLFLLTLLGLVISLMSVNPVSAEPYIAIRTGYKCAQCHVNRSGGGQRTDFGVIYSQTHLYMKLLGAKNRPAFFSNRVSENVAIGANFRAENVSVFQYENVLTEDTDFNNDSRITEANMYFLFDVVPDVLSIYADQTLAPGSANREFFGILQNLPFNSYVKAGRMLLPYGLRLRDDEAFIRNESGFTYNKHDLAVEVGLEPGRHSLIANITQNQMSFVGSVVFRRFRVGGSFAKNIIGSVDDHTYGVFTGANFGRFTLLGEIDFMQRAGIDRLASIAEIDFLLMRGLNLKGIYEFFDRNRDISNSRDGQERFTLGIEAFVSQFVQLSLYYRFNRFIPQNTRLNQDQLIAQFHVFF